MTYRHRESKIVLPCLRFRRRSRSPEYRVVFSSLLFSSRLITITPNFHRLPSACPPLAMNYLWITRDNRVSAFAAFSTQPLPLSCPINPPAYRFVAPLEPAECSGSPYVQITRGGGLAKAQVEDFPRNSRHSCSARGDYSRRFDLTVYS